MTGAELPPGAPISAEAFYDGEGGCLSIDPVLVDHHYVSIALGEEVISLPAQEARRLRDYLMMAYPLGRADVSDLEGANIVVKRDGR